MKKLVMVLAAGVAVMGLSGCGMNVEEVKTAVDAYNAKAQELNVLVEAYNASVAEAEAANQTLQAALDSAQEVLARGDVVLDGAVAAQLEERVAQAAELMAELPAQLSEYEIFEVDESAKSAALKELKAAAEAGLESLGGESVAEAIEVPDYTETITNLEAAVSAYEMNAEQGAAVNAPAAEVVLEKLGTVASISETAQAAAENDPAELLGTEGGPVATIYFKSSAVDPAQVFVEGKCESLLDAGTLLGGSVEIYNTQDEAMARDAYLAGFDGALLTAGGHQVLGTLVVRTSPALTLDASQALVGEMLTAFLA